MATQRVSLAKQAPIEVVRRRPYVKEYMFLDREDAGRKLAEKLAQYRGTDTIVVALPRGGVVVGYEIAMALHIPLDIVVSRKIGHPLHPEYAIGVVDEKGTQILNESEAARVDATWLVAEAKRQQKEATRRVRTYRDGRRPLSLTGKAVILVDDGIATGFSMRLALRHVQAQRPKKIVIAVPVAPEEAVAELEREDAEVVLLVPPEEFGGSVGAQYARFAQVEDTEVMRLLRAHAKFMKT